MKRPKVVVVGSSNTDMVVKMPRLPGPGETILGGDFFHGGGGKGANQAVAAARLGADVTFVGRVGKDIFGRQAILDLQREGICTDFVVTDDNTPSGVALIMVDSTGENIIAVAPGANSALSVSDIEAAAGPVSQANVLLLQLEIPLDSVLAAASIAAGAGVLTILNPAPAQRLEPELLRKVSIITPNESEAEILTGLTLTDDRSAGAAADALRSAGVRRVVITRGARGTYLHSAEAAETIPTRAVTAVDTTAAGDAFNGALSYFIGAGYSLLRCVQLANCAGALAATRLGAQASLPTLEELTDFAGPELLRLE